MRSSTGLLLIALFGFVAFSDAVTCYTSFDGDRFAPTVDGCSGCIFVRRKVNGVVYEEGQYCMYPTQLMNKPIIIPTSEGCKKADDGSAYFQCSSDLCNICDWDYLDVNGATNPFTVLGLIVTGFAYFVI